MHYTVLDGVVSGINSVARAVSRLAKLASFLRDSCRARLDQKGRFFRWNAVPWESMVDATDGIGMNCNGRNRERMGC
jgi:hypothetical protein